MRGMACLGRGAGLGGEGGAAGGATPGSDPDSGSDNTMRGGIVRYKMGFSCYKQNVKGSSSSLQSRAKGSRGRMTEKGDKSD